MPEFRPAPQAVTRVSASNSVDEGALILSGQKVAELEAKLAAARQTQREIATRARVNGMSLRAIAKLAGVSNVAVLKWTSEAS